MQHARPGLRRHAELDQRVQQPRANVPVHARVFVDAPCVVLRQLHGREVAVVEDDALQCAVESREDPHADTANMS